MSDYLGNPPNEKALALNPLEQKPTDESNLQQLDTSSLFKEGVKERTILHAGMVYRLRITTHGKLILTK